MLVAEILTNWLQFASQPLLPWHHLQLRHYVGYRSHCAILFLPHHQVDLLVTLVCGTPHKTPLTDVISTQHTACSGSCSSKTAVNCKFDYIGLCTNRWGILWIERFGWFCILVWLVGLVLICLPTEGILRRDEPAGNSHWNRGAPLYFINGLIGVDGYA